jgi:hypothetical protein
MAFTVPWVATGMNAGVSIRPCGVASQPVRAEQDGSVRSI